MKKKILSLFLITFLLLISSASSITTYNCNGLTGGTQRDLDYLSVSDLNNGDRAGVLTGTIKYHFKYSSTATTAENTTTHPFAVRPDDYATAGVWIEQELATGSVDAAIIAASAVGTSEIADGTVATADLGTAAVTQVKLDIPGFPVRANFTWSSGSDIYIQDFIYDHHGTTQQLVYSVSSVLYQFGSAGSNTDSTDLANNDWFYLYIDDSRVVIAGTNVIGVAQLVAVTEEPVWSEAKHGHYGSVAAGNATATDKCVGGFRTGATANIIEFQHAGDELWLFGDTIPILTATAPSTVWTDATLITPSFATKSLVWIQASFVDGQEFLHWRTNGQTASTGHYVGIPMDANDRPVTCTPVINDSSGRIEVKYGGSVTNTVRLHMEGYYFPRGM